MKLFEFISTAHAQTTKNTFTLGDFNFLNPFKTTNAAGSIDTVLSRSIGLVLSVAAVVAFFYLVISGFQYITAGGDATKATTARQGIINALIGIVIILIAYIVLRFVATNISGDSGGGGFVR